ncbi:L,D-transpeptidase family protein [Aliagarivorans marinus]|uniref:L,D-transpeptidase family protein n=1 Tax=Aliagarivorans marinus TaxID=561965 RepID=UPI0003F6EABD|nr:L,D-transpeptidase family protein [Aliagarivorans marinus]
MTRRLFFVVGLWLVLIPIAHSQTFMTTQQVIKQIHNQSLQRLMPLFVAARVDYPPERITFLASKDSNRLELWADDGSGYRFVHRYLILHASGEAGPKLREGDRQVPEGIYRLTHLNPNSAFHLSIRIDYPNSFDRERAAEEGRHRPGSNIFIHGKADSVGCLAMGDQVIEDLFVLVERVGLENSQIMIAPHDPRIRPLLPSAEHLPEWTQILYHQLEQGFSQFQYQ